MAGSKTILCIEDDIFVSELYTRALKKAGFEVEVTVSGQEGFDKAIKNHYDVILLDIMTPDITGIEALNQLRGAEDKVPDSLVLITTNLDQDEDSRAAMEAKADGYLIKAEITPGKLVEIIQQMIGYKEQASKS